METILLSQSQIQQLVTMKDFIEIVDQTFKGFGEGTTINPTKVTLDLGETAPYPSYEGYMNAMPAYVGWLDTAGLKWAGGLLGERRKQGLPYITSMIMIMDPKLGHFLGVMDGALITNFRTGAQTAVALKYLHPNKTIRVGLFGAGMQGRTQTMAISEIFDIEELRVYDISPEASKKYAAEMKDKVKGEIIIVDSPREAACGDAVICVTQSKEKFLKNEWIEPGTIVFPMGSYQEVEDEFIIRADKIIVDHVEQCLHRGALMELNKTGKITKENISATIGELAAGKKEGRTTPAERILCVPIGTGALDIAVATVALRKAGEQGIGGKFTFI